MAERLTPRPLPELTVEFEGRMLRIPHVNIDPESVMNVSRFSTGQWLEMQGRSIEGERYVQDMFCATEEEARLQILHAMKDDLEGKPRGNWKTELPKPPLAEPATAYVESGTTPHRLGPAYLGQRRPELHEGLIGIWRPIPEAYQTPDLAIYTPDRRS